MSTCVTGDLGPACLNLTGIRAGDKNEMIIRIKASGVPVDITGRSYAASARKKASDEGLAPIIAVASIADGPTGAVRLLWPGDQVRTVLNGSETWKGVWDLEETIDDDPPVTVVAGTFGAGQDVTR